MRNFLKTAGTAAVFAALLGSTAAIAKDITIAVVPKVAVPFFDDCNKGASDEAKALGVSYQWVVPANTRRVRPRSRSSKT
jgi:ribose transport system substrate-binding protein